MPSIKTDIHNAFVVTNVNAVDLANHATLTSVDTDIDVEMADGEDQNPLHSDDLVQLVGGFQTLEAGICVVNCRVKDANTVTLRTTNPTAGAISPAPIAANALKFIVYRR